MTPRHLLFRLLVRSHHAWHVLLRINSLVVVGLAVLLTSHWFARESEARWAREIGTATIIYAYTRWVTQQGKRRTRVGRDGKVKEVRSTTLSLPPDEAAEIRAEIRRQVKKR